MKPCEYDEAEVHRQYDDALKRRHDYQGKRYRIGSIIQLAQQGGYKLPWQHSELDNPNEQVNVPAFDLSLSRPIYHPSGMPAREFAGPEITKGVRLFPMEAASIVVALGGVGKTTFITKMAAHIASGKPWGSAPIQQRNVLIFNVEETQGELNRKYGAAVHKWDVEDRNQAEAHLRQISCLGLDARMTRFVERQVDGTQLTDRIIEAAHEFNAEVIFIDHLQGFTSGDLNNSDTATALTREANKIVSQTGAAVVLAAHTKKDNVNAESVENGFVTGSMAFENAVRQVVGIIPMPVKEAEASGLDTIKQNYRKMELPKNSYGPDRVSAYLVKDYIPDFHTITVEPFDLPGATSAFRLSKDDRLRDAIIEHIANEPAVTPQTLDKLSGKDGVFKAGRARVRKMRDALLADGTLRERDATDLDRQKHGLKHQVKKLYEVS